MRSLKNIMVTGGAGFIGSNFIRYLLTKTTFDGKIVNFDKLTYAGNLQNLADLQNDTRYIFVKGDICDIDAVKRAFEKYSIDTVVHFAAESHVDRSILGPADFINTNILGTFNLLECAKNFWKNFDGKLFHHVSTDEVFGSLGESGYFTETTPYSPRSPYSSSKASSDHLVNAYFHTYGLPVTLSNCSNNYGYYQFPEKLIPVMIENMLDEKPLPVYGDGKNIRDWLFVEDHNGAVWTIMNNAKTGESYNIGGENEWENIKLVNVLCETVAQIQGKDKDCHKKLITFVKDRPGHDRRYAIDCSKIKRELGWKQRYSFDDGLKKTARWYLNNRQWVEDIKSGEYKNWINRNYFQR
ncbi:MAG: dTDP-glucose 4,6-dehydratase [Chitinispirillales bacterium]|jgi:dTDP-glucose 4,6-dehydratase|nr:dTDP-glucose 4,6-dehydratase [Chitinispirillales bacterium]